MGVSIFPPVVVTGIEVDRMVVDFNVVIIVVDIVSVVFVVVVVVCLTNSVEINVECGLNVVIVIVIEGFDEAFVVDKNDMETFTGVSRIVTVVERMAGVEEIPVKNIVLLADVFVPKGNVATEDISVLVLVV